jgi:magnesium chelatase family protein
MYRRKLSGPLMDRIDLFIDVPPLKYEKLTSPDSENSSQKIREKVETARKVQQERFKDDAILVNSEMDIPQIKKYCQVDQKSQDILKKYVNAEKISARGYHRVLKLARTIADLDNSETISFDNVAEAIMYRVKEN